MVCTPQSPQPVCPTSWRPRCSSAAAALAGIVIWISTPWLYGCTRTLAMSLARATISSESVKPTAKSSRSAGVAIITTCGRWLYTSATGTSSATLECSCRRAVLIEPHEFALELRLGVAESEQRVPRRELGGQRHARASPRDCT